MLPITNPKASDPVVAMSPEGIDKFARLFSRDSLSVCPPMLKLCTMLRLFGIIWIQRGIYDTYIRDICASLGWLISLILDGDVWKPTAPTGFLHCISLPEQEAAPTALH